MYKEILSSGQKIKRLRQELGLTQNDIAGTEITRNLISYIENDKVPLTKSAAKIIINNIHHFCKENGLSIDPSINEQYLLEDVKMQANKLADEYIEILDTKHIDNPSNIENIIKEFEYIFMNYGLMERRVDAYKKIGDIYRKFSKYSSAYTYYIKAYENTGILSNNTKQLDILLNLINCCLTLERNSEALELCNLVHPFKNSISDDIFLKFIFNSILAYKRLSMYDECLKQISFLEHNYKIDNSLNFELKTLKANCYKCKMYYTEALAIQKILLGNLDPSDYEKKLVVLCNILEIYMLLNDSAKLKEYLSYCFDLIEDYDMLPNKIYSADIYCDIALALKEINNLELSKVYFFKTLYESRKNQKISIVTSAFENLISIFIEQNDLKKLSELKNTLLEFISLEILPKNDMLILKLINYYNYIGDKETISDILNFIL